jgi:hypothetical protein
MFSAQISPETALLLGHPSASTRWDGAPLPVAVEDPFPLLTLALHNLWTAMRPSLNIDNEGKPQFVPLDGLLSQSPGEAFLTFGPYLVSGLSDPAIPVFHLFFMNRSFIMPASCNIRPSVRLAIASVSGHSS